MGLGFGFVVAKVFGLHGTGTKAFVERMRKKRVLKLIYTFFFVFFLQSQYINTIIIIIIITAIFSISIIICVCVYRQCNINGKLFFITLIVKSYCQNKKEMLKGTKSNQII